MTAEVVSLSMALVGAALSLVALLKRNRGAYMLLANSREIASNSEEITLKGVEIKLQEVQAELKTLIQHEEAVARASSSGYDNVDE